MLPKKWHIGVAFYKGRWHMYSNDYLGARNELTKAFSLCHVDADTNKQRILKYLIPVEILSGNFPSKAYLKSYRLDEEYSPITEACLNGDMVAFENAVNANMDLYI